jgi:hypothetical protein
MRAQLASLPRPANAPDWHPRLLQERRSYAFSREPKISLQILRRTKRSKTGFRRSTQKTFDAKQEKLDDTLDKSLNICRC